jgi:nucleotide-binding universal stress UspA family protein
MRRLLVGMDGSSCSMHAFEWATNLARVGGLEVIAARVSDKAEPSALHDSECQDRDEELEELRRWCASVPPNGEVRHEVVLSGDAPETLLSAATLQSADMLVVGSRGAGGFAHLHVGSVAHHLLHLTHVTTVPLAVVPPKAPLRISRLVAGSDGSAGASKGVEFTAQLAKLLHVPVTAVYGYEPSWAMKHLAQPGDWRVRAEAEVRGWATPIEKAGVELEIYVDPDRDVHPVAAIEYVLRAHPGSVAVLGTRGLGGFSGLRLGRVPLQLVNQTGDSVILVPPFS